MKTFAAYIALVLAIMAGILELNPRPHIQAAPVVQSGT
jgi:hypothetical protein